MASIRASSSLGIRVTASTKGDPTCNDGQFRVFTTDTPVVFQNIYRTPATVHVPSTLSCRIIIIIILG